MTDKAERNELVIATSWFTRCEVAQVRGEPDPREQERMITELFDNDYIRMIEVDDFVAHKTRDVIRAARTRLPAHDAVHIASALVVGASVLYTYDTDHLMRHNGIENLRIAEPELDARQLRLPETR